MKTTPAKAERASDCGMPYCILSWVLRVVLKWVDALSLITMLIGARVLGCECSKLPKGNKKNMKFAKRMNFKRNSFNDEL